MSDDREDIVYDDFAFDEMFQQEEAVFFWSISDSLHSIEMFGAKTWFSSLYSSLTDEQKSEIVSAIRRHEEAYK